MMPFIITFFLFIVIVIVFLNQAKFGRTPSGERLAQIKKSANYKNGAFQNKTVTPTLTEGVNYWTMFREFFFEKKHRIRPSEVLPSVKTDLLNLDSNEDVLVWFGHSSYFMQIDGKRILVDPVFCGSASPMPVGIKAFAGSDIYTVDDLPSIDYLFISHDHWDHLDYETIKKVRPKITKVFCGLGVGAHLEHWGYHKKDIIEKDWEERIVLEDDFKVHTVPARHFSGRGLLRNKSLWMAYVLQTPTMQIFIGGDSGYDTHFAEIGKQFGTFDLAILENGQYDKKWKYIHAMPDEFLKIAKELNAQKILPVHSGKFALGNHPWDEPLELLFLHNESEKRNIITPKIGEKVFLKDANQTFAKWWQELD